MKAKHFLQGLASAVIISLGLVSCTREAVPDKDDNAAQEYVEVSLKCSGEIIDLGQTPLSRSEGTDLYYVQAITVVEYEGNEYYEPYACGLFSDPALMKVKLRKEDKYVFDATMVKDGVNVISHDENGYYRLPFNCLLENTFVYGNFSNDEIYYGTAEVATPDGGSYSSDFPSIERYYGFLENYIPSQGGTVTIDMAKMSFGLNVVTENFTEGSLQIDINGGLRMIINYPLQEAFYTYCLYDLYEAYYGDYMNDLDVYEYRPITVRWTDGEGVTHPVAEKHVTFYRNKKTTIRIRIDKSIGSEQKGIGITVDTTDMTEDPDGVTFG